MKWLILWCISIIVLFFLPYFYGYVSHPLEVFKGSDLVGVLFVFLAGAISTSFSIFTVFCIEKLLMKFDIKISNSICTVISLILTILLCMLIVQQLHLILTET
jgi:hypothetical protein